ncbi:MAG: putative histidine kinase, classic [Variovorax sp.]|nr:putative histidine kinase, classic [Variovorax sp.]
MTRVVVDLSTIDLDNCDREPIHVPGHIQPHGALIAFDFHGRLTHASRNAAGVIASLPALGAGLPSEAPPSEAPLWLAISAALKDAETGQERAPLTMELVSEDRVFDVVLHAYDGRLIVELEQRASRGENLAEFALLAHRSMGQLRSRRDIATMLAEAVETVHKLTGFDRVMAYRFHQDDSGEVVTEVRLPALEPFLGRRFPASDIPVQARALYVRNPLRLIADVHDEQVPIAALDAADRALDLSYSVLRSVSPIHIEYLKNIQVGASMSLSIVVNGRLWGLIACHHGTAHRVPYAVRMTCDVLSHVLSSSVQSAVERLDSKRRLAAVEVRKSLTELLLASDDFAAAFPDMTDALGRVMSFDATLCSYGGVLSCDALPKENAAQLLHWLDAEEQDLIALHESAKLPESLRAALQPFCGFMALCIDRVNRGWIVLLRREQIETIVWSGIPAKLERIGPLGARLTPHGSLAEWRQTVEGTSVAWDDAERAIAHDLMESLGRAGAARAARMEMARAQLLAVLGHDLRDPLQTISMMGQMLELGSPDRQAGYGKRIATSIGRMQRLIGEVFEMSRMRAGLGLGLNCVPGDMAALVRGLVDDARLAHPEISILTDLPEALHAEFDADRMSQVVNNLISNARNHGVVGESIWVRLAGEDTLVVLRVANMAPPIEETSIETLFDPFKPRSIGNVRNPGGLGLGLYIASEVAKGHGGRLEYSHDGTRVTFTVSVPKQR